MEKINQIESFEQNAYITWSKSINTYVDEIKLIEDQLNNLKLTEISKLIDEIKYKIEKKLFSNKFLMTIERKKFLINY